MQPHEQAQFLRAVGIFIQDQLQAATAPMLEKINRLETELIRLKQDPPEKKLTEDDVVVFIDEAITAALASLPKPMDGKDGANGKDGRDADMDVLKETCKDWAVGTVAKLYEDGAIKNGKDGADGKDGIDGKDTDPAPMLKMIEDAIGVMQDRLDEAWKSVKIPKDGKDGRDGADVVSAVIDRDGNLILTLSNGIVKNIGRVVGLNGEPGLPGKNGLDGVGFDDLSFEYDGERKLELVFVKGENVKRFLIKLPIPLDQGVWKPGDYEKGDGVTTGGSWFIAQKDTNTKPELSKDWRLAVKRGDRGMAGDPGQPGQKGKDGRDGRDLTQLGPDGKKWG